MVLEDGFVLNREVVKGKLDSEKNPYAEGKVIEPTDQFMFGPSIMVAPFYKRQAVKRQVQLPAGNWYNFYTGKFVGNGKTITVTAEELKNRAPLFVKEGSIIPMLADTIKNTEKAYGHPLEVRIYGNGEGSYDLYEDDGKSFDYLKGKYRVRKIEVKKNKAGKLVVSETLTKDASPAMFGPIKNTRFMSK